MESSFRAGGRSLSLWGLFRWTFGRRSFNGRSLSRRHLSPGAAPSCWRAAVPLSTTEEHAYEVDRDWEDDGAVFFGGNLGERSEVAQLQRRWLRGHDCPGLGQS